MMVGLDRDDIDRRGVRGEEGEGGGEKKMNEAN
jgi:hypothetical protein